MSERDYELIATTVYDVLDSDAVDYINTRIICDRLADTFKEDNPRFNKSKFMEACGVNE